MTMCDNEKRESKIIAVVLSALTVVAILTVSVAAPLLCRSFYYVQIQPLKLTEASGMTQEQITETFDEVMDFCMGKSDVFSMHLLPWSESGASHFADVRTLFMWDLRLAACSCVLILAIAIYCRFSSVSPYRFRGHGPGFWASAGFGMVMVAVAGVAALDFERAFVVFHSIFFPGKDNWNFDEMMDPVIYILPQQFFRNCAILIVSLIVLWCVALVLTDMKGYNKSRRKNRENVY